MTHYQPLLARTTPLAEVTKESVGMSIFIVDLHQGDLSARRASADRPDRSWPRAWSL